MPHRHRSTAPQAHRPPDAQALLDVLDGMEHVLVCTVPAPRDQVDLAVRPLPEDPRGAPAALIGLRAPEGATAAGVAVEAATPALPGDPVDDHDPDGTPLVVAHLAAVVHVAGGVAVRLRTPSGGSHRPHGVHGPLVDALHRVLGLPAPGEPPMLWELALGWWLRDMADLLAVEPHASWEDLVDLHPALAGGAEVPDARRIALATEDVVGDTSWARLHALAAAGPGGLPGLTADEAAWMDPTTFGRWMVAGLPTADGSADLLRQVAAAQERPARRRLRRLASRLVAAEGVLRERSGLAAARPAAPSREGPASGG